MKTGRLELIIGPMYASKSTEVIRRVNRYRSKNLKVLVINHVFNDRYGSNHITTHDCFELKCCLIVKNLFEVLEKYKEMYDEADIIAIEELQFFDDAFSFVTHALDQDHKQIVAAGLVADYKKERFGQVLDLIPHAEEILHLKAYCALCEDIVDGAFTKRIIKNIGDGVGASDDTGDDAGTDGNVGTGESQILVGTKETYLTVCRYHFNHD